MTKHELLKCLASVDDDTVIVCQDEQGGWDNIVKIIPVGSSVAIVFGGGSPFSSDK